MHEWLLLECDHVVHELEQVDEAAGGQVGLGRQIQQEVHHGVAHVKAVYQLQKILLLSSCRLLIILILSLKEIK